jgi:hypothetical protein
MLQKTGPIHASRFILKGRGVIVKARPRGMLKADERAR